MKRISFTSVLFIISLFVVDNIPGYALAFLFLAFWCGLSRVPLRLLALYMRMTPETLSRIVNKPEFADLKNKQDK